LFSCIKFKANKSAFVPQDKLTTIEVAKVAAFPASEDDGWVTGESIAV